MNKTKIKSVKPVDPNKKLLKEIRQAFADYMASEGCSCCATYPEHDLAENKLGKLLKMKKYKDGSGYDYTLYKSKNG